jgi:phosphatidylserine synthase
MMGIADWITLGNGLLGAIAVLFMILAFDGFAYDKNSYEEVYIWLAMVFILLSTVGDIIDGPIARRYSKKRYLGSYLDLMSDSLSFGTAPALLVFSMFSRVGEATPLWTAALAFGCCWIVICTMLRLARFQYEHGSSQWFNGLASPGSAVILVTLSALIWVQPDTSWGPDAIEWKFGSGAHPALDWLILPATLMCGYLMIADRRLPKAGGRTMLRLTALVIAALLSGISMQIFSIPEDGSANVSFILFVGALVLCMSYIVLGPRVVASQQAASAMISPSDDE